jgi:polysaccharide chain length determinant protein (PEP-CTERM system associated)
MLPGKKYTPEDLVAIFRRRFWLLLVPFAVVSAATALVARALPDTYQAQALVSVVPQQVPTTLVPATVTTLLSDRLQAIQNQVLSRPRLEKLILDLNLYPEERRTGIMQDVVDQMKANDLKIIPFGQVAFRVTYLGQEPVSTMKVVQEVASAFINESLVDRAYVADQTNQFLENATGNLRLQLLEREQRLANYLLQNSGELPTQVDSNVQQMGSVSEQLRSISQSVNNARQQQILLQRERLTVLDTPATASIPPAVEAGGRNPAPASSTAQELAEAQRQLAAATSRYSALHPDVQRWSDVVKALEAKVAAEGPTGLLSGMSPAQVLRQRQIEELEEQLAEIDQQLAGYEAEEKRLRQDFATYKARVDAAPKRDAELKELTRDYDEISAAYSELQRKTQDAMLATDLQRREIGEQFKLLEPATLPQRPFSPNRPRINAIGLVAGLAIGIGLIALLEYRDSGFKTDKQVTALLGLPVLAVVPVMQSDVERRRLRTWKMLMHGVLGTAVAGCLAIVAYTFVR